MSSDEPDRPTPLTDAASLLAMPRLQDLTVSPDGRVVATVAEADEHGARMVPSLWELATEAEPRRLTWSAHGESGARFAADGSLLFTSARPDPGGAGDQDGVAALWRLPERGEAAVVASTPGDLSILDVAPDGTVLAATEVLVGGQLATDAEARKARKESRRTDIWHTGMPIRYWDHELGETSPRLVLISPDGEVTDLAPRADTLNLLNADACLTPGAGAVITTWRTRSRGGETRTALVRLDVAVRRRSTVLAGSARHSWTTPRVSPDGARLAVLRTSTATPTDTSYDFLEVHRLDAPGAEPVSIEVGDLTVGEVRWADDTTLLLTGDLHSSGAVLAADPATGRTRVVADGGVYSALAPSPDGRRLHVLRSDVATPPHPVRVGLGRRTDPVTVPAPGALAHRPGRLERVQTDVDGITVGGWLCTPEDASSSAPVPVMLWIHGGPHGSYNAWSWRWCPWLAVARGYAVLLPDPGMSTGYGHAGLNRNWPREAAATYRECEALLEEVLTRASLDGERTALLGASFGGYLTNWAAGHTDRFRCIVTHAGLWALDQQHPTTDAAAGKVRVHGDPDENAGWYRANSPHHARAAIRTPVLLTHGNRDYRVPVGEALRLWWDLVSGWSGSPASMPHRFLQLTSENHWVLTPSNARVWNEVVLGFCDQHVRGGEPLPEVLGW